MLSFASELGAHFKHLFLNCRLLFKPHFLMNNQVLQLLHTFLFDIDFVGLCIYFFLSAFINPSDHGSFPLNEALGIHGLILFRFQFQLFDQSCGFFM